MTVESATYIHDLNPLLPPGSDAKSEGDNHIALIKGVLQATLPGLSGRAWRVQAKASNYNLTTTDNMTLIEVTGAGVTIGTAASIATLGNGFIAVVFANGNAVTFDPNSTETVNDGVSTSKTIPNGSAALIVAGASEWKVLEIVSLSAARLGSAVNALAAESSPDAAADYIPLYDASAGLLDKLLISTLANMAAFDEAAASDTVAGIIELATVTETATGTAVDRAVTPASLAGLAGNATAWRLIFPGGFYLQGGTVSYADNGGAGTAFTFHTTFPTALWGIVGGYTSGNVNHMGVRFTGMSTSGGTILVNNVSGGAATVWYWAWGK